MPYTEADPVALLVSFLVAFGNAAGAGPHFMVGATRHMARLFIALVGRTAKARKGDSWQPIRRIMMLADEVWAGRVISGIASGEGLIHAVRDPVEINGKMVDEGVRDKRAMAVEPELARLLKVMERQGNTISPVMRDAWDHGDLQNLTKNAPARATAAHISILAHITLEELRREMADVEVVNGSANRYAWAMVKRSQLLPDPEPLDGELLDELATLTARALTRARSINRMQRDAEAAALWREMYEDLSAERDGLAGAILARAEAHVLRFSLVYALLDGSAAITVDHLAAAVELWGYCERSVNYIWGDASGDPMADAILKALRQSGPQRRTFIRDLFGRNESAGRIDRALQLLLTRSLVKAWTQGETGGRPAEMWGAVP